MAADVASLSSAPTSHLEGGSESPAEALSSSPQTPPTPPTPPSNPPPRLSPQDSVDFLLHPTEIDKGRRAAENYLSTFRSEETRRVAEEALETLATVISGGKCDTVEFPWQQVRPYHGAAALTILKEKGAPARIEALRCRRDSTRSYRVVPDAYPTRQVQKIRSTLTKVIEQCCELGFVSEEDRDDAALAGKTTAKTTRKGTAKKPAAKKKAAPRGRLLGDGELRALVAACATEDNAEGSRDAVFFALVHLGLKIAEITALTLDSIGVDNKTGRCQILVRPKGGGRGRRVGLDNGDLICLEDWLDYRGAEDGPLLCTLGRGGRPEHKRLTLGMLGAICERRSEQAKVEPFTTNDLSRSAEALMDHRKAQRRKAAKRAQEVASETDRLLFESASPAQSGEAAEAICFPFLGLNL